VLDENFKGGAKSNTELLHENYAKQDPEALTLKSKYQA
jgi:hypothetical protein